jgi:glycosyltransferase involved in cell wall biosynthesis
MKKISLVTACKNREANLLKVIESWLLSDCDEFVIVDWSCDVPLFETFHQAGIKDKRIQILRVEDEQRWILTHAYNVGLKRSEGAHILKLDNDHVITKDFFTVNALDEGLDALLGSWRLVQDASQAYINGAFLARSKALRDVGYFNELISTYGWDDTYLHESLFSNGAKIAYLDPATIQHIDQDEKSRTAQQAVSREEQLAVSVDKDVTEFMNRRNMYLTAVLPRQSSNADHSQFETIKSSEEYGLNMTVLRRLSNPTHQLDETYLQLANLLAYRDLYAWKHGLKPISISLSEVHELHEALEPLEGAAASREGSQPTAAAQGSDKPNPAAVQKSTKRTSGRVGLPKQLTEQLWKLLPAACSYYGHTTNEFRYQIDLSQLGLDQKAEQYLNGLLPDWAAKKVSFRLKPEPADASTKVVIPWESAEFLIESTLFNSRDNKYFWACMNSLKPYLKRSLYELIARGGKPIDVILNCSVQAVMRGDINQEELVRRLKPLDMIFPSRSEAAFRAWTERRARAIRGYAGNEVADLVESTLLANPRVEEANLTLVTALFKGSRHMITYCLNIRRMHLFERTDVVISIAPSSESRSQERYLKEHFSDAHNVSVTHLETDPGLYECWNKTIRSSKSKYVSNANIDDRRGRYHSDYLIYLMEYERIQGASSALVADRSDSHETYSHTQDAWYLGMGRELQIDDLLTGDAATIKSQNMMHCMPIWKAELHTEVGYFDEDSFGTSADWEFWLRTKSLNKRLKLLDIPLGFYLLDSNSHNRRDKAARLAYENHIISTYFSERRENRITALE